MPSTPAGFTSIWIVLCGVLRDPGEPVAPNYVAVLDLQTGLERQFWVPNLGALSRPPYPTGPHALVVTIDAQDLLGLHLALGWRVPERIIDLVVEFRNVVNGTRSPSGPCFAGALVWFGLSVGAAVIRGDVPDTVRRRLSAAGALFERMSRTLDWGRALLRGRYLVAVARMEKTGVPVDAGTLNILTASWRDIVQNLIMTVDRDFGVYRGGLFEPEAFNIFVDRHQIDWPRDRTGRLDLSEDVFRERARAHVELLPLKELRATLAAFRPDHLGIGRDERNRTSLRPFQSRTGRNQPGSRSWLLGGPAWTRNLIRPPIGRGLAWIDWAQQEFGIAAALSRDPAMQAAYQSGDPYLSTAIATGAAPADATKYSHGHIRNQYKASALGVQNGMGAPTLARSLRLGRGDAEALLRTHRTRYYKFWRWSDGIEDTGLIRGQLESVFGWRVTAGSESNPRFLRNFPIQANGAEMLRLACCSVTEAGIQVCAPLHDALLIEASLDALDDAVSMTQQLMAEASSVVLDGFALRTDVKIVRAPDRLGDRRGAAIWDAIQGIVQCKAQTAAPRQRAGAPAQSRDATCPVTNPRAISLYVSNRSSSYGSD